MLSRYHQFWFRPIDASFLAVFRIMFGGLLLFEAVNYGVFLCLDCMYRDSSILFKYQHFEWVRLWPGAGLELTYAVMGVSALCVMLGLYYRFAMALCTVCFCYVFFLDQALYLNHYYLTILFCCIMIFVPAHRQWSLDARRNPTIASDTVPAWSRLWLVVQLEIVLIYAGLVKLNLDWLNLEPMRLWMNAQSQSAHPLFQWLTQDPGIALASYSVVLLHLIGAPLLLWRKTRLVVFCLYCVFHLINALVFNIGIFPWMTIAATLIMFDPDWPKQFYAWVQTKRRSPANEFTDLSGVVSSQATDLIKSAPNDSAPQRFSDTQNTSVAINRFAGTFGKTALVVFIFAWLLAQVLIPLRHWYIPGDVAWNEGGHRFSWRMKLRSKQGVAKFYVVVNNAPAIIVDPNTDLNHRQVRKMACIPDLIWQYAQYLDARYATEGADNVQVFVDSNCSLNTREPAPLINRLVDLSAIPRSEPLGNWVLPNTKELPKKFISL